MNTNLPEPAEAYHPTRAQELEAAAERVQGWAPASLQITGLPLLALVVFLEYTFPRLGLLWWPACLLLGLAPPLFLRARAPPLRAGPPRLTAGHAAPGGAPASGKEAEEVTWKQGQ